MPVTIDEVKYIASLAKLKLNESELESFTHQLNDILKYIEKLNELDTENVEPLSHPVEFKNVFREDVIKKSISTEEALKNAPLHDDTYFFVPKVINKDSK